MLQLVCDVQLLRKFAEPAIKALLLLFPSTRLCKSTFSVLLKIESKFGSQRKPLGHDLRCAVANV